MRSGIKKRNHSWENTFLPWAWRGNDRFGLPARHLLPLYKYHTVIAQDGHDYFRLGRIGRQAEELMSKGEIDRCIIIGVPYKNVRERRNTYHPEGSKFASYKRFIANELVPFIDKEYPTYQVGYGRTMIGDSSAEPFRSWRRLTIRTCLETSSCSLRMLTGTCWMPSGSRRISNRFPFIIKSEKRNRRSHDGRPGSWFHRAERRAQTAAGKQTVWIHVWNLRRGS